jgi:2-polyprenyl-3-methyl-5-hydroxy-6-metoxy-1,4-benzoquinol methylase
MDYIASVKLPLNSRIIDVGGGASNLAGVLLDHGYANISVLDISAMAIEKTKEILAANGEKIDWVVSDIMQYNPDKKFDFWYDRAVFHFLTEQEEIEKYADLVGRSVAENGHFLLGTFSEEGPLKCSGLEISRYSEVSMRALFEENFEAIRCFKEIHVTPFETNQSFQFCGFKRKPNTS